jgi:hypothetical protein
MLTAFAAGAAVLLLAEGARMLTRDPDDIDREPFERDVEQAEAHALPNCVILDTYPAQPQRCPCGPSQSNEGIPFMDAGEWFEFSAAEGRCEQWNMQGDPRQRLYSWHAACDGRYCCLTEKFVRAGKVLGMRDHESCSDATSEMPEARQYRIDRSRKYSPSRVARDAWVATTRAKFYPDGQANYSAGTPHLAAGQGDDVALPAFSEQLQQDGARDTFMISDRDEREHGGLAVAGQRSASASGLHEQAPHRKRKANLAGNAAAALAEMTKQVRSKGEHDLRHLLAGSVETSGDLADRCYTVAVSFVIGLIGSAAITMLVFS